VKTSNAGLWPLLRIPAAALEHSVELLANWKLYERIGDVRTRSLCNSDRTPRRSRLAAALTGFPSSGMVRAHIPAGRPIRHEKTLTLARLRRI
jgi:hypothetical protein